MQKQSSTKQKSHLTDEQIGDEWKRMSAGAEIEAMKRRDGADN